MIQEWSLLLPVAIFLLWAIICIARLSVHTQHRLTAANERDWLVDGFVCINRHTSRRPH